jgi:hypothetical protein
MVETNALNLGKTAAFPLAAPNSRFVSSQRPRERQTSRHGPELLTSP